MKPTVLVQPKKTRRTGSAMAALMLGLPLGLALIFFLNSALFEKTQIERYVKHSVQQVTIILFCCALGTLAVKLFASLRERWIFRILPLPPWNGKAVPIEEAQPLLAGLAKVSERLQNTYLFRRVDAILDFLCQRGSAVELDDHLRTVADNDAISMEASYGLTRFITWAMPILGFLGTVLGITAAISGVNAADLENGIGQVTNGLGEAFDSTALALSLTMFTMFLTYLVERMEQGLLERVDAYVDAHLTHRFVRLGANNEPFLAAVKQQTRVVLDASEQLVRGQAQVWAETLGKLEKRALESQASRDKEVAEALEAALERTLESHVRRLTEMEKQTVAHTTRILEQLSGLAGALQQTGRQQQDSLVRVANEISAQTQGLIRLQEQGKELLQLQNTLEQNLTSLAGAGVFEQAVHSLTAAIHLLTARVVNGRPAMSGSGDPAPLKMLAPNAAPTGKAA